MDDDLEYLESTHNPVEGSAAPTGSTKKDRPLLNKVKNFFKSEFSSGFNNAANKASDWLDKNAKVRVETSVSKNTIMMIGGLGLALILAFILSSKKR